MRALVLSPVFLGTVAALTAADPLAVEEARPFEILGRRDGSTLAPFTLALDPGMPMDPGAELSALVPNGSLLAGGGRGFTDTLSYRGQANTPIFGDAVAGAYLDGVPLGSLFTLPTFQAGLTRVAWARGAASGTRYGNAGPGGAWLLSTAPLGAETGRLTASAGSHGAWSGEARAQAQAGGVRFRAAAAGQGRDGFVENTRLGADIDGRDARSVLLAADGGTSEALRWTVLATGARVRDGVQPLLPLGGPLDRVERSAEGETRLASWTVGGTVEGKAAGGAWTLAAGGFDWDLSPFDSTLDFGFAELGNGSSLRQRGATLEAGWTSAGDAPWRAGVLAADLTTEGAFVRRFGPFVFEASTYRIDLLKTAVFVDKTWVRGAWRLSAGARGERADKAFRRRETVPAPAGLDGSEAATRILPRIGAVRTLGATLAAFADLSTGFKPGGFSAFTGNPALARFGPETVATLEAGLRGGGTTGRWQARVFAQRIRGYQIERSFATGAQTDDYLVVNAPRARALGAEAEASWSPARAWTLTLAAGAVSAELEGFRDPYAGTLVDGRQVPFVPEWDASVRLAYRPEAGLRAGVALEGKGRTFFTEEESPGFSQGAVGLVGAWVGYAAGSWEVRLQGDNLTDEAWYASITPGTFHGRPADPRTWRVETRYLF